MIYSAYKLNKQGYKIQCCHIPFPILNQSIIPCPVLTGEGNGNPLHCSCLENSRDREAWWAAVYGVTQSRTQLKQLSSSSSSSLFYLLLLDLHTGFSRDNKVVWYSHFFKNFPQFAVIYTVNDFSISTDAEVNVFVKFPCFLRDPTHIRNLISCSSAFSKPRLYIWKFWVHILLKSSMKKIEYNLTSMWNECY